MQKRLSMALGLPLSEQLLLRLTTVSTLACPAVTVCAVCVPDHYTDEHVYQVGPNPPTLQQLRENFQIRDDTLRRIHADMQHVLLDLIIERLADPGSAAFLASSGPVYASLLPLVEPIRERDIDQLLSHIHLLARSPTDPASDPESGQTWQYDQGNVALAFARHCGVDVERARNLNPITDDQLDVPDPDIAETVISSPSTRNAAEPGQGIKGLLYAIAEEQARRTAYVHRGTRCDSCGEFPIKGIRWHCINCADYDLCSPCESVSPSVHPRTHVLAKIKIPISTLAQPHQVHDLWYPGDSLRHWPPLKITLRKKLASESGFDDVALEALYDQFTCLANVAFPNDPADIKAAIDRRAFNKAMSSDKWPAPLEPNFLFDRMFSFYDTDNNSLIGFEEFISGLAYLRHPRGLKGRTKDLRRALEGYDIDGDGLVSRSDFVRMMSAKYAVQRHIIHDVVAAEEAEIVAHTGDVVRSSQPISAAFTGEDVPQGETRVPDAKTLDESGEWQVAVEGQQGRVTLLEDGHAWDSRTINAVAGRYHREDDLIGQGENFRLDRAEEARERYSRVELVPIPATRDGRSSGEQGQAGNSAESHTFLVETDSRSSRGQHRLEPAQSRWTADLADVAANDPDSPTVSQRPTPTDLSRDEGTDLQPDSSFDSILNRGRSYPVPENELFFGREVLYQVIQEAVNETLDPLFYSTEDMAQQVRMTRKARQKWRRHIDDFVRRKTDMMRSSDLDPLIATAFGQSEEGPSSGTGRSRSVHLDGDDQGGDFEEPSDGDREGINIIGDDESQGLNHSEPLRSAAPSPTARASVTSVPTTRHGPEAYAQIFSQFEQQIQEQMEAIPTNMDDLEDLEMNIRQQPLEQLLEESGYSIASPEISSSAALNGSDGLSVDQNAEEDAHTELLEDISPVASHTVESPRSLHHEVNSTLDFLNEGVDQGYPESPDSSAPGVMTLANRERRLRELDDDTATSGRGDGSENHELFERSNMDSTQPTQQEEHLETRDEHGQSTGEEPSLPLGLAEHTNNSPFITDLPHNVPTHGAASFNNGPNGEQPRDKQPEDDYHDYDGDKVPSQSRLEYFARMDEEEKRILRRGGPGRLTFAEVEQICLQRGGHGQLDLLSLIDGWLEWAGF